MVVNTNQTPAEGQHLSKGDKDGVVDLAQRWATKARHQHRAPESAQCSSENKLKALHNFEC